MQIDDDIVKLVTKKVMEALNNYNSSPISNSNSKKLSISDEGEAIVGVSPSEVVVAIGASFSYDIYETMSQVSHYDLIKEVAAGIEEEGMTARFIRVYHTSDVAFMALMAAKYSGSGIGIGIQSKGTTVIHQKDLFPLTNLELFSQAPLITLDIYRKIGKNAARYAKGQSPEPIAVMNDCMVRPKFQAKAAILHIKETNNVVDGKKPMQLQITF
jgi:propanediol dehydratase medium subunit